MFWFFGHPEVYVLLFPTLGVIGEIIPTFARKPLFGYKFIIGASIVAIVLSMIVWAHHQFVAGINPYMAVFFSVGTILISIPFAGIILSYVATIFGGNIRLELPMWWAVGFLATFLIGGLTGLYLGSNTFDIYAHDTSFVVAHFHYTLFPITFFGFFAAFYYWFPKYTGKMYDDFLGKLHFWGTFIFFQLFALPIFFLGLNGQHAIYLAIQFHHQPVEGQTRELRQPLAGQHTRMASAITAATRQFRGVSRGVSRSLHLRRRTGKRQEERFHTAKRKITLLIDPCTS